MTATHPTSWGEPASDDPLVALARHYLPRVEETQRSMLLEHDVPPEAAELVDELAGRLDAVAQPHAYNAMDPYLGQSLLSALLAGEKGLRADNEDDRRRQVRLALERVRQTLRDVADEAPVAEGAPSKAVVRWLVDALAVPQDEVAKLLGVSPRTLKRWVADHGPAPDGGDETRVRVVARTIAHLRHVYTGPGAVRWFFRAHPALDGRRPVDLLDDALQAPALARLAARSRSTVAT
jgi:putative toxin-antitoxin system antitoxin component (TIGR02293 family)